MNKQSQSFKENYDVLRRIADELQQQDEPDIDELVPKVEQALAAYRFCKERIESVRVKLQETLADQKSKEIPERVPQPPAPQPLQPIATDLDDEVPF